MERIMRRVFGVARGTKSVEGKKMPWLEKKTVALDADRFVERWLGELVERLSDGETDRSSLVAGILSEAMYGCGLEELQERAPLAALGLDPRHVTLEAEYYVCVDQEKFARVKPLLWLWKCLDLTPLGQSVDTGVRIRRALAPFIFKRVGKNFKAFQNVEFSVGYNIEMGDNVVVHRHVLLDDIGGLVIGDGASFSDFVNVYSHTHNVLATPDVTLKQTVIGRGVRITYQATVLAGVTIGDDAMVGAMSVVTRDVAPHSIVLGVPARPHRVKVRDEDFPFSAPYFSEGVEDIPHRKPNSDYPEFHPRGFGTRKP